MRFWVASAVFLAVPCLAHASPSVQEVLLRAKPAVALVVSEVAAEVTVTCPTSGAQHVTPPPFRETGTGWFISPSGWVITNGHVVSPAHRPQQAVTRELVERGVRQACGDVSEQDLAAAVARAKVKLEPSISVILSNGMRLSATVAKYRPAVAGEGATGRDLALLKLEAADVPALSLGDSSNAKIGDRIHILGFPGVVLSHELLNTSAKVEASVTNGAISGFKQDIANQPVIQVDAPATWGNSGGPAVGSDGAVLGVLTFVTLDTGNQAALVQGFNFVIPAAAVREFVTGTGVTLDEVSRFNTAWHAGLRDFFAGRYDRAEKHFVGANRLLPELTDVRRMMAEAKNPPPRPFPWRPIAASVAVAAVASAGVLFARRRRRNRYRIWPSEVMRLIESSPDAPPVILDVRDAATYAKSPVQIQDARHLSPDELEAGVRALGVDARRTVVAYCS
ncbi:MAG: trypsin-like peptidase domain-containing protein [Candidatus Rokuibacteriota bacterium]